MIMPKIYTSKKGRMFYHLLGNYWYMNIEEVTEEIPGSDKWWESEL